VTDGVSARFSQTRAVLTSFGTTPMTTADIVHLPHNCTLPSLSYTMNRATQLRDWEQQHGEG
jgi:hypothetical protein